MGVWLNWLVLLAGLSLIFVFWSWVPLQLLDRFWKWSNPVLRPFLDTIVLTGIPAFYAKAMQTPLGWLLIPICFGLTQYAALTGRFLETEMLIAGWVMVLTSVGIWIAYFAA